MGGTSGADEAKDLVAQERPDVVVVDLSLDEHDGIELIRELSRKRIQVIAYSDYRDDRLIARSLNAGALGFAVKDDDTDRH